MQSFYENSLQIENNHPLYGKNYHDEIDIEVHGNLTYANSCDGDTEFGICHLSKDNDESWWFGFDCNHAGDFAPFSCIDHLHECLDNLISKDIPKDLRQLLNNMKEDNYFRNDHINTYRDYRICHR